MKKIGLIDYYLDEWHANHYPAWIAEANAGYQVCYAYAEADVPPSGGIDTDTWCQTHGITRCMRIEELCERSDCLILLSPDHPEKHLPYAKTAFRYGKPCYVDKTFAPNAQTAKEIFALADAYHTPIFSSSALRFATELIPYQNNAQSVSVLGGGNLDNYLIHFVEILVTMMGAEVATVSVQNVGANTEFACKYQDGRVGCIHMYQTQDRPDFEVSVTDRSGANARYLRLTSPYFQNMIHTLLAWFDGAPTPVRPAETVAVMALLDAIRLAAKTPWKEIPVQM